MNKKKILKTILIIVLPILGFGVVTSVINNSSNVQVDRAAPDFTLNDTSGNAVTLSSFKGKYVLLDFWAGWCKDCRIENKNLVKEYNKYSDREDFMILSVSLDFKESVWKKVIALDGLAWPHHVSDLKKWKSPVAKLYGVKSIPATFLINKEGNIIAEDLTGKKLEEKLAEVLGDVNVTE